MALMNSVAAAAGNQHAFSPASENKYVCLHSSILHMTQNCTQEEQREKLTEGGWVGMRGASPRRRGRTCSRWQMEGWRVVRGMNRHHGKSRVELRAQICTSTSERW